MSHPRIQAMATLVRLTVLLGVLPFTACSSLPRCPDAMRPLEAAQFHQQPSYTGECLGRPAGTVCARYSDHYIWLVNESVVSWSGPFQCDALKVQVAHGEHTDFRHVLGTKLVQAVPR